MLVYIRADASVQIGTGHVMRCLTLAEQLRKQGADVQLICRKHRGHLCDYIEQKGFIVHRLPTPVDTAYTEIHKQGYNDWLGVSWEVDIEQTATIAAKIPFVDWMIVDHYAIDRRWEQQAYKFARHIMVVDDLANRPHACDILLDQNLYGNMEERYDGLVSDACKKLLGPRYALLREEFQRARSTMRERDGFVKRVLVFFGGSDPTNETEKALHSLKQVDTENISIDVVIGGSNVRREQIESLCMSMKNVRFHCQIDYMSDLMAKTDLSIGAGGTTTWERCFMGLPAIVITTAANQIEVTEAVSLTGALYYAGHYDEVSVDILAEVLVSLFNQPLKILELIHGAKNVMSASTSNGADEVVKALTK